MNLAIHDVWLLAEMHRCGRTRSWKARGVVAWMTPGQSLGRAGLVVLQMEVPVQTLKMSGDEEGFFLLDRRRLRGVSHREAELLFLAERTGSVVLTGEEMIADEARRLGLRVCSGDAALLDAYFPLLPDVLRLEDRATQAPGSELDTTRAVVFPQDERACALPDPLSPSPNPSSRRVPVRDESVEPPPAVASRRSSGSCRQARTTQCNQNESKQDNG